MVKALIKLFSDVAQAEKALSELKAKGYRDEELGILAVKAEQIKKVGGKGDAKSGELAGVGAIYGAGKLSEAVAQSDTSAALAEAFGLPKQSVDYYSRGLLKGGTVISVHVDKDRQEAARQILREVAPNQIEQTTEEARKSGFQLFDRMTDTNPVDRQLSGDFRKY